MVTIEESWEIIKQSFGEQLDFCVPKNHSIYIKRENTFRFTVNILSLEVLFALLESDKIKNVFFHPSKGPEGAHVDAVAMRYRVYIEYY